MSSPTYTYSGGTAPDDFVPTTYSELGDMIGKIAFQVIREVNAENPLSVFEKMPVENGDTIEQAVVKLADAQAYDSTGSGALSRKTPAIAVKMFSDWNRGKFETTVDIALMRKVLTTGKGAEELSSKVVGVLSESDKYEHFSKMKDLFAWGRQDGDGKVLKNLGTITYGTNAINYSEVLKTIKNTVKGMTFVNSDFNTTSGLKRSTKLNDIYILMPYKLKTALDVDELAGVFNLDKAEINSRIIEIDTDLEEISSKDSYVVYIVDQNAVLDFTRLYEMADQKNADGLFWNYFLHYERMYGLSPLFDGAYFVVNAE